MLLRVLRDIFTRTPHAGMPRDEAGFDQLMQNLVRQGRKAETFPIYDAAIAAGIRPCDREFDRAYRRAAEATGTPPTPLSRRSRFYELYRLLGEVLPLEGDIAECGCFRGLSSHVMLSRLKQAAPDFTGRNYHIFDSFEGLSEPSAEDMATGDGAAAQTIRAVCRPGWFAASIETVRRGLAEFPDVSYHPGWIPASLEGLPERRYRFVHLDLDLHDPTLGGLEYFYPRLVPGAILVCDDYDWPGERKAIETFCARTGISFALTPHGQAVLRRSAAPDSRAASP